MVVSLLSMMSVENEDQEPKQKNTRSKLGCFNCRKKKKKCDELKPVCSSCAIRCIRCNWPKTPEEKLPDNYTVPTVDREKMKKRRYSRAFVSIEFEGEKKIVKTVKTSIRDQIARQHVLTLDGAQDKTISHKNAEVENTEKEDTHSGKLVVPKNEEIDDSEIHNGRVVPYEIIEIPSSMYSEILLNSCIDGFIKRSGPQLTHPLLTTIANFSPLINQNEIMRKVALACGIAHMSWIRPEVSHLAYIRYEEAFNALSNYFRTHSLDTAMLNQNWLCAAAQLLCLCSRTQEDSGGKNCVKNLILSYQILKIRFGAQTLSKRIKNENDTSVNLQIEIENSLIDLDKCSDTSFDRHFNKMYLESFLYNYSATLLISPESENLPNPFEVFKNLRHLLKTPLFACEVVWMNNPVFGAAIDSYEILVKASYLSKLLYSDPVEAHRSAKKLYDLACFYPVYVVPLELRADFKKYETLRDSVIVSEIVSRSAKILLRKILILDIDETDTIIQADVDVIVRQLKKMSSYSQTKAILTLPLLIGGAAAMKEQHRTTFVETCYEIGDLTHSRHSYSVISALQTCWNRDTTSSDISTRGLNMLFNREMLSKIVV